MDLAPSRCVFLGSIAPSQGGSAAAAVGRVIPQAGGGHRQGSCENAVQPQ